ncbi:SDR family oxidoreductase [Streptomyces zaomyceticus]|uniref:SDR family oxidoreductase n=1 Tax=Streptomyces zaomyceticus TaxID=68286 RepID=UPI0036BBB0CF
MTEAHHAPPLRNRTILVVGATGGIGEGMTRALLQQGATVVATGRNEDRLASLAARVGDDIAGTFLPHTLDVASPDSAAVRRELVRYGPLDGAVITIGNWGTNGPAGLLQTLDDEWDSMIAANLTSHFRALRTLVPLLPPEGALVHLTGYSAEVPYPSAPLIGATNAAKKSLMLSLTAELGTAGPRLYELIIGPIRTRPRAAIGADDPGWFSAEDLGHHAGALITGHSPYTAHPLQYLLTRAHGVRATPPR